MLLVPTHLAQSPIHGIGVFASENIPKGTRVWELTPGLDLVLDANHLTGLNKIQKEFLLMYSYVEARTGQRILCCDHARHFNFCTQPNTGYSLVDAGDIASYALRGIQSGEELTFSAVEDLDSERKLSGSTRVGSC